MLHSPTIPGSDVMLDVDGVPRGFLDQGKPVEVLVVFYYHYLSQVFFLHLRWLFRISEPSTVWMLMNDGS